MNPTQDMWVCSHCGEKNILERLNCYSCLSCKPGPRTPPGPQPRSPPDPPPDPVKYPVNNGGTKKKTWPCKSCNSVNSHKSKECYLCDTVRPPSVNNSEAPKKEHDWFCKLCHTQNFSTRSNCYTCSAFKESGDIIATPSGPDIEYWACSSCSYKTSHGPHCFQCGSGKTALIKDCPNNWKCSKCEIVNFGKRAQCYACHKKVKRSSSLSPVTCSTCKFCNDPSAKECLVCGSILPITSQRTRKASPKKRKISNPPISTSSPVLSEINYYVTPEDWKCQSCDYRNIALRNFCKDCDTPRKCIAKLYIKYKKHGISSLKNPGQLPSNKCKKCHKSFPGKGALCTKCTLKEKLEMGPPSSESSTPSATAIDAIDSVMYKKCTKCGAPSSGQYCYECADVMGIRLESDTWECQNCHLVDENTAICTSCGHNKSEAKIAAVNFLTCKHCKTKNHAHKTHCVRCLEGLTAENLPNHAVRSIVPESWKCQYCEIVVPAQSTHCRGCNRARSRAAGRGRSRDRESDGRGSDDIGLNGRVSDEVGRDNRGKEDIGRDDTGRDDIGRDDKVREDIEDGEYVEDANQVVDDYYFEERSYSEDYYAPPPRYTPRLHYPTPSTSIRQRPPFRHNSHLRHPHRLPHQITRPSVHHARLRPPIPSPRFRPPVQSPRPRVPSPHKLPLVKRRQAINMMGPSF